jgi:hypothetical protein
MAARPRIELRPPNPLDVRPEDLADLSAEISDLVGSDYEVVIVVSYLRGLGVTWGEILNVWLPDVEQHLFDHLVDLAVGAITGWMARRFLQEGKKPRPKFSTIFGPDGKVLKKIKQQSGDSKVEDITDEPI